MSATKCITITVKDEPGDQTSFELETSGFGHHYEVLGLLQHTIDTIKQRHWNNTTDQSQQHTKKKKK